MIGKINFKDLSFWLKASIVFGWASMAYFAVVLLIGLIILITG